MDTSHGRMTNPTVTGYSHERHVLVADSGLDGDGGRSPVVGLDLPKHLAVQTMGTPVSGPSPSGLGTQPFGSGRDELGIDMEHFGQAVHVSTLGGTARESEVAVGPFISTHRRTTDREDTEEGSQGSDSPCLQVLEQVNLAASLGHEKHPPINVRPIHLSGGESKEGSRLNLTRDLSLES
jgi:hypothetical protein